LRNHPFFESQRRFRLTGFGRGSAREDEWHRTWPSRGRKFAAGVSFRVAAFLRGPGHEIASPRVYWARKTSCYHAFMNTLESLSNRQLLDATRALATRACEVEADLLVHLAEIDERRLYVESAFPSLFAFCLGELGFSED